MTIFTYCSGKNSFFIALTILLSGLIILKFSSPDKYPATSIKDGQSVVTIKNFYRTLSKANFIEAKSWKWLPEVKKITSSKESTFNKQERVTSPPEKFSIDFRKEIK